MTAVLPDIDIDVESLEGFEYEVPCDTTWILAWIKKPCRNPADFKVLAACSLCGTVRDRFWCTDCLKWAIDGRPFECRPCKRRDATMNVIGEPIPL